LLTDAKESATRSRKYGKPLI